MYDRILINTMESYKEKLFKQKCTGFLSCICARQIIVTPYLLNNLLSSEVLTTDDINQILLKKYFVSKHKSNKITEILDECIERKNFNRANNLITNDPAFIKTVLNIYLNNVDTPNNLLAMEKTKELGYYNVVDYLESIDTFYNDRKLDPRNILTLKKNYKI